MFLVEKNEAQRAYEIINTMIEEAGRIGIGWLLRGRRQGIVELN
jgi:hypothetical protein